MTRSIPSLLPAKHEPSNVPNIGPNAIEYAKKALGTGLYLQATPVYGGKQTWHVARFRDPRPVGIVERITSGHYRAWTWTDVPNKLGDYKRAAGALFAILAKEQEIDH